METEEILFENSFLMTQERYLAMCNEPKSPKAVRQLRQWIIRMAVGMACGLILIVLGMKQRDPGNAVIGICFFLFFSYMLFLRRRIRNKKLYAELRRSQSSTEWRRVVRFYDSRIEIEDVNVTVKIKYDEIVRLTEEGDLFLLWRGEDQLIRLMRGEFTRGSADDFIAFIHEKIAGNAGETDPKAEVS